MTLKAKKPLESFQVFEIPADQLNKLKGGDDIIITEDPGGA